MTTGSKVAFVTGAASGIGRATADAFARDGYRVALVDRAAELGAQAAKALSGQTEARFFSCDVTDESAVEAAIADTISTFGRIDAAFNGAGIDGAMAPTAEGDTENFDRIMAINLRGLWFCMKYQLRQMLAQGGGAIVNCASSAGLVGVPGLAPYAASKHGVVGLTRTAALEYARQGIRVNAVCPGMIDTPMWQRSISPEMTEQLLATDPAGRMGQPQEVAEAAVWLCSAAASFVNGQALAVDGGLTAD